VCTPPAYHPEASLHALANGVHVLCEKPFAIDSQSAIRMINKAEEKHLLVTMASKFRFVDDIAKAKSIVEAGILGEVVLFEITFCNRVDVENNWPSNKEISGGGVLIDNGTHAVDIARFLVGPILRVQAQHGKQIQKIDVEDTAMLFIETRSGVWGRVDLSWSIHKDTDYYINIFGSKGMLSIGWKHSRYRQNEKNEWVTFGTGYNKLKAFVTQLKHFVECVQNKAKPIINSVDSFESVKVIEMAYESSKNNKWLDVR
jgi:predicted dehydrogenase